MSEPFKNLFNDTVIRKMAGHFQHHWTEFDAQGFTEAACYQLETLELNFSLRALHDVTSDAKTRQKQTRKRSL